MYMNMICISASLKKYHMKFYLGNLDEQLVYSPISLTSMERRD